MCNLSNAAEHALMEIQSDIHIRGHSATLAANSARVLRGGHGARYYAKDALRYTRGMIERLNGYCDTLESELKEQEAADA